MVPMQEQKVPIRMAVWGSNRDDHAKARGVTKSLGVDCIAGSRRLRSQYASFSSLERFPIAAEYAS
jgi:hypothetical protein